MSFILYILYNISYTINKTQRITWPLYTKILLTRPMSREE